LSKLGEKKRGERREKYKKEREVRKWFGSKCYQSQAKTMGERERDREIEIEIDREIDR
jgi:hypothetical protein